MNKNHSFSIPEKSLQLFALLSLSLSLTSNVAAHGNTPPSLKGVAIPVTPGLLDGNAPIVIDKIAAVKTAAGDSPVQKVKMTIEIKK